VRFVPSGLNRDAGSNGSRRRNKKRPQPSLNSVDWMTEAVDAAGLALWNYDVPSGQVRLSQNWARMLGLAPAVTNTDIESLSALVPAEEREAVRNALLNAMRSPAGLYRVEHRLLRADGARITVLSVGQVVERDAGGRVIRMVGSSRDMGWYAETQEALRRSEQRFKTAVESSAIGIALVSPEGRWLKVNSALCRIVGYAEGQLLNMTFQDITHPDDLDADLNLLRQTLAGKRDSYEMEKRYIHRDGREVWVQLNVALVRDSQGAPVQFVSQIQDITERQNMVQALRDSEERLNNALKYSPIGMALVALDGRFVKVNRSLCEIVGYTEAELLSLGFPEITHPDDLQLDLAFAGELVRGARRTYEMEKRYIRKDGSIVWVQLNGSVVRNDRGEPLHFIAQVQDISERRRTRQALKESHQRLEFALRGGDLGTWDWDLETGRVAFNERWAEMLGYRLRDIEPNAQAWEKLIHPDDLPRVRQALDSHLRGETPLFETEHRMRSASGEWLWMLDRGRVVELAPDGRPLRISGTHLDVNDRKAGLQHAEHLALHDALTDLPNQRLLLDRAGVALALARRKNGRMALMFVDLDGFKSVNDTLGHATGDTVLRAVANRLRDSARNTDTIARIGGDEFVVLCTESDAGNGVEQVARRIIDATAEPVAVEAGAPVRISASVGIARYPDDAGDVQGLLERADEAMYDAKRAGGARFRFCRPVGPTA
jgi:diguanylate cyclase (GGDEF)-like protein/PAS domain S-box-containing protein